MITKEIRERIDELTPIQLLQKINASWIFDLEWDFNFYREIADKIDTYELYGLAEKQWLRAASVGYFRGITEWNDRLNQLRELLND